MDDETIISIQTSITQLQTDIDSTTDGSYSNEYQSLGQPLLVVCAYT
jgi:hypothetical protein